MDQMTADAKRQAEAVATGRRAEAEGRPVIYVHGRPYADPGDEEGRQQAAGRPAGRP